MCFGSWHCLIFCGFLIDFTITVMWPTRLFRSVQSLDQQSRGDDSAVIFFQSFLWEAIVSSSGMGKDILSLTLSIQHFLCWPQHHPPSLWGWLGFKNHSLAYLGFKLSRPSAWGNFSSPTWSTRAMTGCEARSTFLLAHWNLFLQLREMEISIVGVCHSPWQPLQNLGWWAV